MCVCTCVRVCVGRGHCTWCLGARHMFLCRCGWFIIFQQFKKIQLIYHMELRVFWAFSRQESNILMVMYGCVDVSFSIQYIIYNICTDLCNCHLCRCVDISFWILMALQKEVCKMIKWSCSSLCGCDYWILKCPLRPNSPSQQHPTLTLTDSHHYPDPLELKRRQIRSLSPSGEWVLNHGCQRCLNSISGQHWGTSHTNILHVFSSLPQTNKLP